MDINMKRKPLIIIQARLNSSRYPRKILSLISDVPSIVYQYRRIQENSGTSNMVVAIPNTSDNDQLNNLLRHYNIPVFRGHATNVLSRFIECANWHESTVIVRVNGDCPLISPSTITKTLTTFFSIKDCNYVSTILDSSFPLGEHCECFDLKSLEFAQNNLSPSAEECEHVTPILYNNSKYFKCFPVVNSDFGYFNPKMRLCIDYPEDLVFIHSLLKRLPTEGFELADIVKVVNEYPELVGINSQYMKDRTIL